MFISSAWAQQAGGLGIPGVPEGVAQFVPLVLIFAVFYFLLIRPQQKKMKTHRNMVAALRRGDRVVTAGGIIGLVTKVLSDNELQVEIAEGVRVRVTRASVTDLVAKTEPAPANDAEDEDKAEKK